MCKYVLVTNLANRADGDAGAWLEDCILTQGHTVQCAYMTEPSDWLLGAQNLSNQQLSSGAEPNISHGGAQWLAVSIKSQISQPMLLTESTNHRGPQGE